MNYSSNFCFVKFLLKLKTKIKTAQERKRVLEPSD